MKFEDLLQHTSEWLKGIGPNSNIVISSRIRLARNLEKIPFPNQANKDESAEVLEKVKEAVSGINLLKKSMFLELNALDNVDKQFLIERHLMSHEHAMKPNNKGLVVSDEEIISIMVNEEDHLRVQVMRSGLDLNDTWEIIDQLDNALAEKLNFAFLPEWGYLTACPTNTGTGMRGSVMLHLPALVMTKQINKVLAAIAKLSFTTRGLYGEGTQASGNFFQISNQVSLGHSEIEILENLKGLIKQVVDQEEQARQALLLQSREVLEDRIWRAAGTLRSAYIISSEETIELLSMIRLGVDLGVIKDIDRSLINELFIITQPAHLQKIDGKKLSAPERDAKRAKLIRQKLTRT
ncbi:MAG: protein arginine kinase [Candidatus Omnitrophota bacterium]|nr:protein arginine kinase [Candidatus Omnitrophota bacterium]